MTGRGVVGDGLLGVYIILSHRRGEGFVGSGGLPGIELPGVRADRLSDKKVRAALAHEVVAVRSALSVDDARADRTRRVVLALLLHRAVSASPALQVRRDADPIDRFFAFDPAPGSPDTAGQGHPHPSIMFTPWAKTVARRDALDPLLGKSWVDEAEAYRAINQLDDRRLDTLIESLIVAAVSGSLAGRSPLVALLAADLEVDVRASWTPDAEWFKGYRKLQLARLLGELRGPTHGPRKAATERRKKSELVEELASLFKEADAGRMTDADLSARVNAWTPGKLLVEDANLVDESDKIVIPVIVGEVAEVDLLVRVEQAGLGCGKVCALQRAVGGQILQLKRHVVAAAVGRFVGKVHGHPKVVVGDLGDGEARVGDLAAST